MPITDRRTSTEGIQPHARHDFQPPSSGLHGPHRYGSRFAAPQWCGFCSCRKNPSGTNPSGTNSSGTNSSGGTPNFFLRRAARGGSARVPWGCVFYVVRAGPTRDRGHRLGPPRGLRAVAAGLPGPLARRFQRLAGRSPLSTARPPPGAPRRAPRRPCAASLRAKRCAGNRRAPVLGLSWLATLPEYRGRGIARHVLAAADHRLRGEGPLAGVLTTRVPQFFGRAGWVLCGRMSRYAASARRCSRICRTATERAGLLASDPGGTWSCRPSCGCTRRTCRPACWPAAKRHGAGSFPGGPSTRSMWPPIGPAAPSSKTTAPPFRPT